MALDAKQLADTIMHSVSPDAVHALALAPRPAGALPDVAGTFCKVWPQARPILVMVGGIIVFIPGAGSVAGSVLQGLIKVGDQVSAEVCKIATAPASASASASTPASASASASVGAEARRGKHGAVTVR